MSYACSFCNNSLLNKERLGNEVVAVDKASAVESTMAPARLKFFFIVLPPKICFLFIVISYKRITYYVPIYNKNTILF